VLNADTALAFLERESSKAGLTGRDALALMLVHSGTSKVPLMRNLDGFSYNLGRLRQRGLVTVLTHPYDRRRSSPVLTIEGAALAAALLEYVEGSVSCAA